MAALADEHGVVDGLTTGQRWAAAGVTDRTYRRVRGALLVSGELILRSATGGRGNTNCWEIPDLRSQATAAAPGLRGRVAPPDGVRPLVAAVAPRVEEQLPVAGPEPVDHDQVVGAEKDGQDRTVSQENRPALSGVWAEKGCQDRTVSAQNRPVVSGVSLVKGGQDRTLSRETPAKAPAKTPAANARGKGTPGSPPQPP